MSKEDSNPVITVADRGPYIVVNLNKFENLHGRKYLLKPVMSLCRCGESKDKPYCDGAHNSIEIDWEKNSERTEYKWKNYVGDEIIIHFNLSLCSHNGACRDNLPEVFNLDSRPWINANGSSIGNIIETIKKCPSGALSYTINNQKFTEYNYEEPIIKASKKGPIEVLGGVELKDPKGNKPEVKDHYVLCGCGWSKNKPFCDGHHLEKIKEQK